MPVELTTLTDGGQPASRVAGEIATFVNGARASLDLALYALDLVVQLADTWVILSIFSCELVVLGRQGQQLGAQTH